jgi:hypothetical protein
MYSHSRFPDRYMTLQIANSSRLFMTRSCQDRAAVSLNLPLLSNSHAAPVQVRGQRQLALVSRFGPRAQQRAHASVWVCTRLTLETVKKAYARRRIGGPSEKEGIYLPVIAIFQSHRSIRCSPGPVPLCLPPQLEHCFGLAMAQMTGRWTMRARRQLRIVSAWHRVRKHARSCPSITTPRFSLESAMSANSCLVRVATLYPRRRDSL